MTERFYVGPLEKQHYNEFFTSETKDCLSDVSGNEWTGLIKQLVDEATGAELHGLVNTAKRHSVSRAIAHGQNVAVLEHRDLVAALASVPHLFAGYVGIFQVEVWDDEGHDEDDDWVVP